MNMKKTFILTISAFLVTASAFAWSKKTEGQANLGRTYISIEGGAQFNKFVDPAGKHTPTDGVAGIAFNVPVFKPGVNALKDVSWIGLDAQAFFGLAGGDVIDGVDFLNYKAGIALVPYLNFETGWSFIQAIKPFAYGRVGYEWMNFSGENNTAEDENYVFYGFGGGVEIVATSSLSLTGQWNWYGNAQSGMPCSNSVSGELTYWLNGMFATAIFAEHNFGANYDDYNSVDFKHGTTIGLRFKIGFNR